ncbi:MAG TPA: 50S ribosomal protein L25 [Candidatus Saccharimonadales bacterium]|nr:50S ribosomal protein L25 [Candidatus Saccharimonadales bacterium]
MQNIVIDLQPRTVVGKAVKKLRKEGMVPAVIHDHGKPSIVVQGEYVPLLKAYESAGKHHPVNLTAGGKNYMALIKFAEFSPKKHELRHVVFNAVKANQTVDAEIPVQVQLAEDNDATPAERAGLVVLAQLDVVEVEALPKDLPDQLYYDGEKLTAVGDQLTVADLIVPKGVTVKTDPEHVIVTVFEPSALAAANDAAGGDAEDTDASAAETEAAEAQAEGVATDAAEEKKEGK